MEVRGFGNCKRSGVRSSCFEETPRGAAAGDPEERLTFLLGDASPASRLRLSPLFAPFGEFPGVVADPLRRFGGLFLALFGPQASATI